MTSTIFTALRNNLLTNVVDADNNPVFLTVAMWNNQIDGELAGDGWMGLLPACFIEFTDIEDAGQNQQKVLHKKFKTILHIVYESLSDTDVSFLDIKQLCYKYTQWFEVDTCSKFLWKQEITGTAFTNLRTYQQVYTATLKDFTAQTTPIVGTVANMTTTPDILPNI